MHVYPSGTVIRTGASEHVTAHELPFIIFRRCHLNAERRKILKCLSLRDWTVSQYDCSAFAEGKDFPFWKGRGPKKQKSPVLCRSFGS